MSRTSGLSAAVRLCGFDIQFPDALVTPARILGKLKIPDALWRYDFGVKNGAESDPPHYYDCPFLIHCATVTTRFA